MGCCANKSQPTAQATSIPPPAVSVNVAITVTEPTRKERISRWKRIRFFNRYEPGLSNVFADEIKFYKQITKHWDGLISRYNFQDLVVHYTEKYNKFMLDISKTCEKQIPSPFKNESDLNYFIFVEKDYFNSNTIDINIILFWRIHMLHPILYKKDCQFYFKNRLSQYSQYENSKVSAPSHKFVTQGVYDLHPIVESKTEQHKQKEKQQEQGNVSYYLYNKPKKQQFTEFDFSISLEKNLIFMKKMIDTIDKEKFNSKQQSKWLEYNIDKMYWKNWNQFEKYVRYKSEFQFPSQSKIHLCPTLTIDFIWHTCMMFPITYYWTLDHNDLISKDEYKIYKQFSLDFWKFEKERDWTRSVLVAYAKTKYSLYHYEYQQNLIAGFVRTRQENIFNLVEFPVVLLNLCFEYVDKYQWWDVYACQKLEDAERQKQRIENQRRYQREQEERERRAEELTTCC